MRWAIAFHPEQIMRRNGRSRLVVPPLLMPEDRIMTARAQGWIVLGADSDVYPNANVNVQSNPRRQPDDGEDGA